MAGRSMGMRLIRMNVCMRVGMRRRTMGSSQGREPDVAPILKGIDIDYRRDYCEDQDPVANEFHLYHLSIWAEGVKL